jgi:hypothetical protein
MAANNIDNQDIIRVFVAATPSERLPMRVLEFSILETTVTPVEVSNIFAFNRAIPRPLAPQNWPRTPFSFQRFLIPELCGYAGRAIYLDADMQVFQDIAGLWNQPFRGCDLQTVKAQGDGRRGQFSVMLLDCERLCWRIEDIVESLDNGTLDYDALMFEMKVAQSIGRDIETEWNSLECFVRDKTALLHYTDMHTQPWVSTVNPFGYLWIGCLRRALAAGFISRTEIEQDIANGFLRPSLLPQLDSGIDNPLELPNAIRRLDSDFEPPFRRLNGIRGSRWSVARAKVIALLRQCYYQLSLSRLFR